MSKPENEPGKERLEDIILNTKKEIIDCCKCMFWVISIFVGIVACLIGGIYFYVENHKTLDEIAKSVQNLEDIPSCPAGETCTINRNCQALDGTSFCKKDVLIKECPNEPECPNGQSVCTLYDGSTGCSTYCDGVPECMDLSDETPCNKYKCKATWRMVYEHDANGSPVAGNKSKLREAVRKGAEVRMILITVSYVYTPETTFIIGDEVCGQDIFHVSKGSWSTFQSKASWGFTVACTTADFAMSRWYVGSRTKPNDTQVTYPWKWFIREVEDKNVLTVPTTRQTFSAFTHAIKKSGYGITVKQKDILQKEEYNTADNIEISPDGTSIVAQTVWNLLNENFKTVAKASASGNWLFKNFGSDGSVEFSKYMVGENTRVAVDSASLNPSNWFLDPCWQMVYAHSASGNSIEGSKQLLINAVMAGHRVKVMVKHRISQVTTVIINKGVVTAFLPNMLKKSNISTLEDPAKWEWLLVNTNGKLETATYLIGEASGSVSSTTVDIKWFVDTREWSMVLDVGPDNAVNSGSNVHILNEIENGADVLYAWVSSEAVHTFMEADNIHFGRTQSDIGAQHLRYVLLTSVGSEYKFDISSGSLTWFFTITTISGEVKSSKWKVGEHVSREEDSTRKRVVWFTAK